MTELALVQHLHLPFLATLQPYAACPIGAGRERQANEKAEQDASKCQRAIHAFLSVEGGTRRGTAAQANALSVQFAPAPMAVTA
jgi:hypothetical protein